MMKRKMNSCFVLLLCTILLFCCSCSTASSADSTSATFAAEDLLQKDGSFAWKDMLYGKNMQENETAMNITFPDVPYDAIEWMDGTLPDHPELVKDYRNSTDYDQVEFAAYINGKPLVLQYGEYRGHITFEFDQGQLAAAYIYFGMTPSIRDENMTFDGVSNDLDGVFDKLKEDLETALGPIDHESTNIYGSGEPNYYWKSETEIEGGFTTQVLLDHYRSSMDPERDMVMLVIERQRFDGETYTRV